MVEAYALIGTATGTADEVCRTLRDAPGVTEAHVIAGEYDVMAELTGEEPRDILETITTTVRPLEGVGTTRTYLCID